MNLSRLDELLELYFDRRLDAEGMAELESLLRADPEGRKLFWEKGTLEGVLHEWGQHEKGRAAVAGASSRGSQVSRNQPLRVRRARLTGWHKIALVSWAAVAALATMIYWDHLHLTPIQVAATSGAAVRPVALLVESLDAVWGREQSPVRGAMLPASKLELKSGQATLLFTSGVSMVVGGPAELDLESPDRVFCHEGKVRVHVPKGAEGFVIESPQGVTTDLGTELSVDVTENLKTQVEVFEGIAEARMPLPNQEGVRTQRLMVNSAVQMVSNATEIALTTQQSKLPSPAPKLLPMPITQPNAYAQAVLSAGPRHYWRLDRRENDVIPNEVANGPALRPQRGTVISRDESGSASALMPGEAGGGLAMEQPWQIQRSGSAVELWFATDSFDWFTLAALSDLEGSDHHVGLLEFSVQHHGPRLQPRCIRYLARWPANVSGGVNLYTDNSYLPCQWHHVVAQQTNLRMELFVDGELVRSGIADEMPDTAETSATFGFAHTTSYDKKGTTVASRFLAGRMAHIALYDRALTHQEIEQHAALGGLRR